MYLLPRTRPLLLIGLLLLGVSMLFADDWQPLDPDVLQRREPKLDPKADAEIIYWNTRLEDRIQGGDITLVRSQYARIKIYTERGRETHSTIDLTQVGKGQVSGLKARTIKPDGTIIPLEKNAVFQRDVAKVSGFRVRKHSFSLPNVEVGDVIEYQWIEFLDDETANYQTIEVQRDLPTWRLVLQLKPIDFSQFGYRWIMKSRYFQCEPKGWSNAGRGFVETAYQDIPAYIEEPWGPPEEQVRGWILVYYEEPENPEPDKFWKKRGRDLYADYKRDTKVDNKVKALAAELTEGKTTDDEKLNALIDYCRIKIKNLRHPLFEISTADIKKWKPAEKPSQTIENGYGSGSDINKLFVALAAAAGYDARITRMAGRDDYFFDPSFANGYFLRRTSVAIRIDDKWRFFDLSNPYIELGMLSWQEEGVPALISDPKEPTFVNTPMSPPDRNLTQRTAHLKLAEDGSIEGTVEVIVRGHDGARRKYELVSKTEEEQIEFVKEGVTDRYDSAEISNIEVLNVKDVTKPLTYRYKVTIPAYAQHTGKRVFLTPSYFQRNYPPRFRTSERKYAVVLPYGWSDVDNVYITLPPGYELDNADAPTPIDMGQVGSYESKISIAKSEAEKTIILRRRLIFGRDGALVFPVEAYTPLKNIFEHVSKSDDHVITLVKTEEKTAGGGE